MPTTKTTRKVDPSAPDPDEAPRDLDWGKARRARDADGYRRVKAAHHGATIAQVHLEDGRDVYEAYHQDRLLGRFASLEEAKEHARRLISLTAEA
jgi:hypothetical protein